MLKGPSAILYGAVEPGGIVNILTKQPTMDRTWWCRKLRAAA